MPTLHTSRRRRALVVAPLATLALALAACGDDDDDGGGAVATDTGDVRCDRCDLGARDVGRTGHVGCARDHSGVRLDHAARGRRRRPAGPVRIVRRGGDQRGTTASAERFTEATGTPVEIIPAQDLVQQLTQGFAGGDPPTSST